MRYLPSRFLISLAGYSTLVLFLGGLLSVSGGCGKHPKTADEEAPAVLPPAALLVEQQVSGMILGSTLRLPTALVVSDKGTVYLIDSGNRRVIWFDSHLTPVRDFYGGGGSSGRLSEPAYLTVDSDGTLWITDHGSRLLTQCSDRLEYIAEIEPEDENAPMELIHPTGIAVTGFGDIWIGDLLNSRIAVLDAAGQVAQYVGDFGYAGGALNHPGKLLIDDKGKIYVCDTDNRRIVVYDDRGSLINEIKHSALENPVAVTLDGYRRLWVLDKFSGRVHCFDRDGAYVASLGPMVSGTDQPLKHPSDLVFVPDGRLVISDTGNDRLLVCQVLSGVNP